MPEEIINKEIVDRLIKIKGSVRGVVFKTDKEYILKEKGQEGIKIMEKELKRLGIPLDYKEIKTLDFYPVGLRAISLLTMKKSFNFDDKEIEKVGLFATKVSFIIRLFIRYFLSLKRVFLKESPKIWEKHWSVGKIIPVELNEKEKYGIVKLSGFNLDPIFCRYLRGYFCGIVKMLVKEDKVICKENKCAFLGDDSHEFVLKW